MVRSPALEVISYLKKTDDRNPAVRYLFCILQMATITLMFYPHDAIFFCYLVVTLTYDSDGLKGSGKTMSLCHVVHFCYTQGWLVLHIPDGEMKQCYHLSAMSVLLLQEYLRCPPSLSCIGVQLTSG